MARKNDIASFFYYMWNCWDEHECAVAFEKAECGWRHLWNKYREYNSQNGHYGAVEEFFANLDDRNQNLLVERALEMYSGKNVSNEKDIQSNRGMCYCYTNIKSLPLELCVRCSR